MTGNGWAVRFNGVPEETIDRTERDALRRLRKARELTQEQLASQVGCSQTNLADIESGRSQPSLRLAIAIAAALETTVDELFVKGAA